MAPSTSSLANTTIFRTPGFGMIGYIHEALRYGEQIRDEWIWEFPLLDGAIFTFQQMAAGREWRVSGPASQASRCVDWLNNAISYNEDGTIDRGWVQFESRRVPDHLCVGRTMFAFRDELEYLDPVQWRYNMEDNIWENIRTEETYRTDEVVVHHPIPLGAGGRFRAPLSSIIPTAMLAWLIREHDRASADGRKIRDITLVVGEELAKQINTAIKLSLELWSGANPASTGAPIAYIEPGMNATNVKASDYVARVGLANIPDNFDREQFQFQYVNEIADITGLALRHIWNSEKATNRALEEVQEARQTQKGPSMFTRTEQTLFRDYKVLRRFGPHTRMSFIEEVDSQSRKVNAEVLKLTAEALQIFAGVFGGTVNGDAFLGWMQREGQLPADIDLITNMGQTLVDPNNLDTPDGDTTRIASGTEKSIDPGADLRHDEVTIDMYGKVLARRPKIYTMAEAIYTEKVSKEFMKETAPVVEKTDFLTLVQTAKTEGQDLFFATYENADTLKAVTNASDDFLEKLYAAKREDLTEEQCRFISSIVRTQSLWEQGA